MRPAGFTKFLVGPILGPTVQIVCRVCAVQGVPMSSVVMQPSGKFRAFARVKAMKENRIFEREEEASKWAEKLEERMRAGKWTPPTKQSGMTIAKAFEEYVTSEEWLAKAEVTRKVELGKQKPVIAALGEILVSELTDDEVQSYIAKRRKVKPKRSSDPLAKLSGTQIRLEVAALSSMLNYGGKRKWVTTNVAKRVTKPTGDRRTARLTDEVIGGILQHDAIIMDSKAYAFFRILFTTVCRPGELSHALKPWLREDPPQIHIPRTKNEDARTIVLPVSLFKTLQSHLSKQPADCPYIFGTKKLSGPGWSPYNYAVPWRKAASALGVSAVGAVPYLARHEGISRLFERTTLSDRQIAGLSGHRSSQALWHYKHLRNEHQRPIVDTMDAMINDAINRAISPSHPSEKLKVGEMLMDKSTKVRMRRRVGR